MKQLINLQREYMGIGGGLTGNAENIKRALESKEELIWAEYLLKTPTGQVRADIAAYAQSQQKEPDRNEIMERMMLQQLNDDDNRRVGPSFILDKLGYSRDCQWKSEYFYQYCAMEAAKATDALITALKQSKQ